LIRFRLWVAVVCGICCLTFLAGISAAADTAPSRVLLFPFTIHAEKDLSFLNNGIQSMLAARLTRQGAVEVTRAGQTVADEAEALRIGAAQGARAPSKSFNRSEVKKNTKPLAFAISFC
jgi:hypothetical protein